MTFTRSVRIPSAHASGDPLGTSVSVQASSSASSTSSSVCQLKNTAGTAATTFKGSGQYIGRLSLLGRISFALRYGVLHYAVLHCVVLYCVVLRCAVPCSAAPCCDGLVCAALFYAALYDPIGVQALGPTTLTSTPSCAWPVRCHMTSRGLTTQPHLCALVR